MQQTTNLIPAGKAFGPSELSGGLNRKLEVPAGRSGVLIGADGNARILPPGTHRVLSWGERLAGKGAGLKAGYVPAGAFPVQFQARYFLSGDGVLLDAWLSAQAEVIDPARFFSEFVLPSGTLEPGALDLSSAEIQTVLGSVARRYTAADLTAGLPARQVSGELAGLLGGMLEGRGLRLLSLQALSFWRSDERVKLAEKIQALEERLQDVELQKRMAAVETQAQYEEFVHQVAPELSEAGGLQVLVEEPPAPAASKPQPAVEKLSGWLRSLKGQATAPARWRLSGLFDKSKPSKPVPPERPLRAWWLSGVLWIVFLLITGAVVTLVSLDLGKNVSKDFQFGWVTGLWLIILPLVLDAVRRLVEKREKIAEERWRLGGAAHIDHLTGSNRARADRLVREQVGGDLKAAAGILDDLVSRVYRSGNQDLALRIRELRRKFEDTSGKVDHSSFGAPVYLSDLKVSARGWELMLDYDEGILGESAGLADLTHQLQEAYAAGSDPAAGLAGLESRLDTLIYHFSGRERALKNSQLDSSGG